mgnify:CR=1 FL=1
MKSKTLTEDQYIDVCCPLCNSCDPADYEVMYPATIRNFSIAAEIFSARRVPDGIHYQIVRCRNDGLVRSTPIFKSEKLDLLYAESTVTYQDEIDNLVQTYLAALDPVLQCISKDCAILEIGAGSGFMMDALKKSGFTHIYGVETSADAVRNAPRHVQSTIMNKPFNKKLFKRKFDFIYLLQTLDHIPNVSNFIADCYDLLNEGGYILSFHHNVESLSAKVIGERHPIFDIEHTQLFSPQTSIALLEKNGFITLSLMAPANYLSLRHLCHLVPFPPFIKKHLLNIFKRFKMLNFTIKLPLGNTCIIARKPTI